VTLLADNDVLLCLAAFDLLEEACAWFGVGSADIEVLATASFRLRKPGRRLSQKYGEDAIARALAFAEQVGVVAKPSDTSELDLLTMTGAAFQIDPGEATLFAATAVHAPYVVLSTGDKRCLAGVAELPGADALRARLSRKVVCLEYVLLGLVDDHGFAYVRDKVWEHRGCNGAVKQAFGWSDPCDEGTVREGLQSHIRNLDTQTAGMLRIP
jgi:hypothetical protein